MMEMPISLDRAAAIVFSNCGETPVFAASSAMMFTGMRPSPFT